MIDLESGIKLHYSAGLDKEDRERFCSQFENMPISFEAIKGKLDMMVSQKNYGGENPCDWFVFPAKGNLVRYTEILNLPKDKYSVDIVSSDINPLWEVQVKGGDRFNFPLLSFTF